MPPRTVCASNLLLRQVIVDSFLQTLSYALGRDGVYVARSQDFVDDEGVGGLNLGGEWFCSVASVCAHTRDMLQVCAYLTWLQSQEISLSQSRKRSPR